MALVNAFGAIALDSSVTAIGSKIPTQGQKSMANSTPVTIASDQSAVPVSGTFYQATQPVSAASLPLPSGAATESTLSTMNGKVPSLGQAVMASSTPVVIASNQSAIPVSGSFSAAPTQTVTNYSQSGVIAINTDIIVINCSGATNISVHVQSLGTTGVLTPAWSNDGTNYINCVMHDATSSGTPRTTLSGSQLTTSVVLGKYFRLRMTTATTAGTTTVSASISSAANSITPYTYVGGSVTVSGSATNTPVTPTTTFTNSAASTNATSIKASAGNVWSIICSNDNASPRYVKFYNKASAPTVGTDVPVIKIAIPASSTVKYDGGATGIRFATGIALAITTGIADSDTSAVAANEIKVATSYT